MIKINASNHPPTIVEEIHLKKSLFSDFSFNNTITFALTNDPIKYERKLASNILIVLPKTTEYASAFSKKGGAGMIMVILKKITAMRFMKNPSKITRLAF